LFICVLDACVILFPRFWLLVAMQSIIAWKDISEMIYYVLSTT